MSSLIDLLPAVLLVALIYTWYRCHKQLRAKGYGPALISIIFTVLLFVALGLMGSTSEQGRHARDICTLDCGGARPQLGHFRDARAP